MKTVIINDTEYKYEAVFVTKRAVDYIKWGFESRLKQWREQ